METQPNTENVVYMDEYKHLEEKVRLRRLAGHMGELTLGKHIIYLPELEEPDDIA